MTTKARLTEAREEAKKAYDNLSQSATPLDWQKYRDAVDYVARLEIRLAMEESN